jgi:hypothetical protein
MSRRRASKHGEKCGYTDDELCIVTPGLSDLLWSQGGLLDPGKDPVPIGTTILL